MPHGRNCYATPTFPNLCLISLTIFVTITIHGLSKHAYFSASTDVASSLPDAELILKQWILRYLNSLDDGLQHREASTVQTNSYTHPCSERDTDTQSQRSNGPKSAHFRHRVHCDSSYSTASIN
jgi:hypothetical protein